MRTASKITGHDEPTNPLGFVYFIEAEGDPEHVKIGSSLKPGRRRSELQTAHPTRLELVGEFLCTDYKAVESAVQLALGHLRAEGEWFRIEGELADIMNCVWGGGDFEIAGYRFR